MQNLTFNIENIPVTGQYAHPVGNLLVICQTIASSTQSDESNSSFEVGMLLTVGVIIMGLYLTSPKKLPKRNIPTKNLQPASIATASSDQGNPPSNIDNTLYKSVNGWLLLLCVWMVLVIPLSTFAGAAEIMNERAEYCAVGLAILSLLSGILLWCRKPMGVSMVKAVLTIVLIVKLFTLPQIINRLDYSDATKGFLMLGSIIPAAWLIYLSVSKRVNATYFDIH